MCSPGAWWRDPPTCVDTETDFYSLLMWQTRHSFRLCTKSGDPRAIQGAAALGWILEIALGYPVDFVSWAKEEGLHKSRTGRSDQEDSTVTTVAEMRDGTLHKMSTDNVPKSEDHGYKGDTEGEIMRRGWER